MENVMGCAIVVAVTFPVSFLMARVCLSGVMRLCEVGKRQHHAR
jgi:hypothetical protein